MKTIVTIKGGKFASTIHQALTTEEYAAAQKELAHRHEQLDFDPIAWRKEMQEASDKAGIREQLRFYGPGKVWNPRRSKGETETTAKGHQLSDLELAELQRAA